MILKLDKPADLKNPCDDCLKEDYTEDCVPCDKRPLYDEALMNLAITLDPSKTYIIKDGKCREVTTTAKCGNDSALNLIEGLVNILPEVTP
jgi:hypothetical protein